MKHEALTRDVQELRPSHNYAPDSSIRDVATALRRHVDERAFERALDELPPDVREFARDFWSAGDAGGAEG